MEYAKRLEKITPEDPEVKFGLAKFSMVMGNRPDFYRALGDAVKYGGLPMREKIATEPMFQQVQAEPDFQKLVKPAQ
jgi:hypothetical protein